MPRVVSLPLPRTHTACMHTHAHPRPPPPPPPRPPTPTPSLSPSRLCVTHLLVGGGRLAARGAVVGQRRERRDLANQAHNLLVLHLARGVDLLPNQRWVLRTRGGGRGAECEWVAGGWVAGAARGRRACVATGGRGSSPPSTRPPASPPTQLALAPARGGKWKARTGRRGWCPWGGRRGAALRLSPPQPQAALRRERGACVCVWVGGGWRACGVGWGVGGARGGTHERGGERARTRGEGGRRGGASAGGEG